MSDDLSEKIAAVLSNPEALAKISSIASGLGGNPAPPPEPAEIKPALPAFSGLQSFTEDKNTRLLYAIKPFLRREKQDKIDSLVRALSVAQLVGNLKKGDKF